MLAYSAGKQVEATSASAPTCEVGQAHGPPRVVVDLEEVSCLRSAGLLTSDSP
jgi:hypothetical protein